MSLPTDARCWSKVFAREAEDWTDNPLEWGVKQVVEKKYNIKTEEVHDKCGTPDCCGECTTAEKTDNKYTQRQWDRTVGYGKVPDEYKKE